MVDERVESGAELLGVRDLVGDAVDDDRAVVEGVVEGGAREDEAVDEGHGQADGQAGGLHTVARRAQGREPVEPWT